MLLKNANILIIDDDEDVLTALRLLIKISGKSVTSKQKPKCY